MKINSQDEAAAAFLAEALTQADVNGISWKNLPWAEKTKRVQRVKTALNKIETEIKVREMEEEKRRREEDEAREKVVRLQTTIRDTSENISKIEHSLMSEHEKRRLANLELVRAEYDLKVIREKKKA